MPTRPAAEARSHLLPAPPPLAAAARPAPRHSLQGCRAAGLQGCVWSPPTPYPASPGRTLHQSLRGIGLGSPAAPGPHPQGCPRGGRARPLPCGGIAVPEVTARYASHAPAQFPSWPAPLRELISCWMAREGSMSPPGLRAASLPPSRAQPRTALPRPEPQPGGGAGRRGLPAGAGLQLIEAQGQAGQAHAQVVHRPHRSSP